MQQISVSLNAGKTVSELKEDKNRKTLLGILRENVSKYLGFKCNFFLWTCVFMNLYIDIGSRYIPNMKTCSVYNWHQKWNNGEINAVHYIVGKICENIARIRQKVWSADFKNCRIQAIRSMGRPPFWNLRWPPGWNFKNGYLEF